MLIRQKAGWRLHHQAYLWPRRSRTSQLSAISTSLLLPQRRRSGGSSAAQIRDDSSSLPLPLRRSSSSGGSCVEEDETYSSSPSRTGSIEAVDSPSPSSASSSSADSTPRKRKPSGSLQLDTDEIFPTFFIDQSTGSSNSGDQTSQQYPENFSCKRIRRGSIGIADNAEGIKDHPTADTDSNHVDKQKEEAGSNPNQGTCCETRSESTCGSIRTRRDTRSGDSRGVESASSISSSNINHCFSLKGSNVNSSSGHNNNNHIPLCGSNHTSFKETNSIRESVPRHINLGGTCSRTAKMGVLCAEKHDIGERCECEGMAASSPRPAAIHSFPPSPCESNSQDSLKRAVSRKRSLDATMHDAEAPGCAVIRRRTHRSPSAGSINGVVGHVSFKEKLHSDISAVVDQNGFKSEPGLNGLKVSHGYQNGTRPFCCLGMPMREACSKCMAHHHPAVPGLSSLIPLQQSQSPQPIINHVSQHCLNGRATTNSHGAGVTPSLSRPTSTSVSSAGSTAQPTMDDSNSSRRPHPPSSLLPILPPSLSSPAASTAQPQHLHQIPQGSISSTTGSSISSSCSSSSDDNDGVSDTSAALSSRCISASSNPTVLSLRQRPLSGNTTYKSLSQPASPQASTSSLPRSKPLLASSSLPSLSTLVPEPSSPGTQKVVQCRWRGCSTGLDASDLLEHIRKHVESQIEKKTYACLWTDCKVFNKPSWSDSWLERHIVSHSGHRPFKCILDNCGQRFHSQAALERHVNGHFAATGQNGTKSGRTREEVSHRMLQKRKRQLKRKFVQTVKRNDFFDDQTMAVIKHELISLADHTELDLTGNTLHTTFHGLVVGRRSTKSGSRHALVEFSPSDVIEDKWSPAEEAQKMSAMSVLLSGLPNDTITNLHNSFYRPHRFRKHRRK